MSLSFGIGPFRFITDKPTLTEFAITLFVNVRKDGLQKDYGEFTLDGMIVGNI